MALDPILHGGESPRSEAEAWADRRKRILEKSAKYLRDHGLPDFAPARGICFCGADLVAIYGEQYGGMVITGCPKCRRSYCD